MTTRVKLDDELVSQAKAYTTATKRTVPKQIEHWAYIGRMLEENPDLTYQFALDAMRAKAEKESGLMTKYEQRKRWRQ